MNTTTTPYKRRLQGNYAPARPEPAHPIKAEVQKHLGNFSFIATFEEDRETLDAFRNEGLIAYRCVLKTPDGRVLGIGHGLNVLSAENRYLSKSVRWAYSGAFIAAVTNAVKFPDLSGTPGSDFGANNAEIASAFMATDRQKAYIRELVASLIPEDEQEEWLAQVETMSKEDASEAIQMLKN
jgi:hypothetical protein